MARCAGVTFKKTRPGKTALGEINGSTLSLMHPCARDPERTGLHTRSPAEVSKTRSMAGIIIVTQAVFLRMPDNLQARAAAAVYWRKGLCSMLPVSATGIWTRVKTRSPALSPAALPILISRCAKDMVGGIPVPCPKCGSKHFLCYLSEEKAGITIFYCMAAGCGHEWVIGDMNPESGAGMKEPELSGKVPGHG